ncbi:hypothetical protein [Halomicrobium urmianum]|uniref:hypothetical protein n=1 Tax=Halomicrobium urmianum TaxID=1586233 RepID=UPI001CD9EE32|nr:hypothetical protein [Halomicrobium urmianum]
MHRSECLALLGALPLAGCLDDGSGEATRTSDATTTGDAATATDDAATATAADAPGGVLDLGETAATDGPVDVTVESVSVQRSVIDAHTWCELREPAETQVLVAETAVERDGASFGVRLDGEPVDVTNVSLHGDTRQQAVTVPVRSAERGLLVLDEGDEPAWSLPDDVLDHLGSAAEFRLREAVVREADHGEASDRASESERSEQRASSEGDSGTELALTVENSGDRDGTFRGIVVSAVAADADAGVGFPVPADETVTEVVRDDVVRNWEPTPTSSTTSARTRAASS